MSEYAPFSTVLQKNQWYILSQGRSLPDWGMVPLYTHRSHPSMYTVSTFIIKLMVAELTFPDRLRLCLYSVDHDLWRVLDWKQPTSTVLVNAVRTVHTSWLTRPVRRFSYDLDHVHRDSRYRQRSRGLAIKLSVSSPLSNSSDDS